MNKDLSHNIKKKRIAIVVGAGYVPGINTVITGATIAANNKGWDLIGIRDGFAGLLNPEKYPEGGLVNLTPQLVESLDPSASGILGQSERVDPFNVRTINELEMIEEIDMSDELIKRIKEENIDGVIAVVGAQGLTIMYKLHLKGLNIVCIPRSIENDIAKTSVSFGFNTALTFTIEMLDRARQAAQATRKIAVVEVLGDQTGWIALQAGIATCADAVLIPEIPVDLKNVAAMLKERLTEKHPYGLVVVAKGAKIINQPQKDSVSSSLKSSLSPLATSNTNSEFVINSSGQTAQEVAGGLQMLIATETFPMVIGPWVRGGNSTAVDRQLGIAYGAEAINGFGSDKIGVMVSFVPPEIKFVSLAEAINKVRTISKENEFLNTASSLGIYCGK